MSGNFDSNVQRNWIQLHVHAEPVQPRNPRRGRIRGSPILASCRNSMLSGSEVLFVQYVRTYLCDKLQKAFARLSVSLRTGKSWVCAFNEAIWIRLAGANGLQTVAGVWRQGISVHGCQHHRQTDAVAFWEVRRLHFKARRESFAWGHISTEGTRD